MIGQHNLQSRISQLIENRTFPRFSIFVGPKGSGKKTFAREIAKKIKDAIVIDVGLSVSDVRSAVENSYKMVNTVVRIIPDADNMSNAAKNALLKVTEEPPNNAYFIMTLEDENNTLETIRSRGTVFHMDRYTPDEIEEYAESRYTSLELNWTDKIKDLCETPGEVDLIVKMGTKDFYDYVQLVVDNIAEVSLPNAFKIANKVALKDGAEGYDLRLFWRAFIHVVAHNRVGMGSKAFDMMKTTSRYLQKLRIRGINRQMLFDSWILEIRKEN